MSALRKNDSGRGGFAGLIGKASREARGRELPQSGYYLQLSRPAMGCQFEVLLRPEDRRFVPAVHEALDEIDGLEQQISVYRPDSEISVLNRSAFRSPVPVESRLYALICLARQIGSETGGALDLAMGALIRCWGFLERKGRVPDTQEFEAARAVSGWERLELDDARVSIAFDREGTELNLGSIGKGYALDRASAVLRRAGLQNFLMHAGQSSILASGDSNRGPGWEVSLRDPDGAEGGYGSLRLMNQGMSTSGSGEQFFVEDGRRFGHILDPLTGRPAFTNRMASVVAPDATAAEAFSTAFFVMDGHAVRRYCAENKRLGAIIFPFWESASAPPPLVLGMALKRREEEAI